MGEHKNLYQDSDESLKARVDQMTGMRMDREQEFAVMPKMLGMLDMTTLEGSDNEEKVAELCRKSVFSSLDPAFPNAAAVCVYPSLVQSARRELEGTGIRVASVAGGFPAGQTSLRIKLEEVRWAVGEGADEIDTVISRGKLIRGDYAEVYDEIAVIREVCGPVILKVILETGELPSPGLIRKASELSIRAGADFIKTSTGKIATGATPEAFLVMLGAILDFFRETGKVVGVKAAGGIRTPKQALVYYRLAEQVLGEDWTRREYFRIGASSLADTLIAEIAAHRR